ncbi:MAG: 3-oxoacyl-[acyl-carrier protein] reductase [Verrucomicrobiota bacterium]
MPDLRGSPGRRVVLITGMSRGLGMRLATAFWCAGFNIFGTARDLPVLEASADKIRTVPAQTGQRIAVAGADLRDPAAPTALVARCIAEFGELDVLICNAAIQGPVGPFWEQYLPDWESALTVDLLAPVRLAHASLQAMLKPTTSQRTVLFLSGGGAAGPRPRFTAYATSKTGIVRFAETLAAELEGSGISVNCIAPGAMPTDMLAEVAAAGIDRAGAAEVAAFHKAKSTGEAVMDRAAALAVFLATTGAGITGKLIAAQWDRWEDWPKYLDELNASDVYTLRRITGRDRNKEWGDR